MNHKNKTFKVASSQNSNSKYHLSAESDCFIDPVNES